MSYHPYAPSKARAMRNILTEAVELESRLSGIDQFFRKEEAAVLEQARRRMRDRVTDLTRIAASLVGDEAAYQKILEEHRRPKIMNC